MKLLEKTASQHYLPKLNICIPYNPQIPLLNAYLPEIHTYIYQKTCTRIFAETLSAITKKWEMTKTSPITEHITNRTRE